MRPRAIWTEAVLTRERVECADDEALVLVVQGELEHRPPRFRDLLGSETMVYEEAAAERHRFAETDIHGDGCRGSEQGGPVTKRVEELGVIAVERDVGSKRDAFLGVCRLGGLAGT